MDITHDRAVVHTITLTNTLGGVNCYLLKTAESYILIDTGWTNRRSLLERRLEEAGCNKDNLKLIILTHGDFDHSGNCHYLSRKFCAQVAMHVGDAPMVEKGDMFWNRKKPNPIMKLLAQALFKLRSEDRFTPSILLSDGQDLNEYNVKASVVHIPGHSSGSIGVLTAEGDLFCGDLFESLKKPRFNSIMDNKTTAENSYNKLKVLNIGTVYPGHGSPFRMEEIAF